MMEEVLNTIVIIVGYYFLYKILEKRLWGGRMRIIKTVWYSLFTANPHAVGITKVDTGKEIQYFIGYGEGKSSKEDAKKIVETGFRFYPEIFKVEE